MRNKFIAKENMRCRFTIPNVKGAHRGEGKTYVRHVFISGKSIMHVSQYQDKF